MAAVAVGRNGAEPRGADLRDHGARPQTARGGAGELGAADGRREPGAAVRVSISVVFDDIGEVPVC